jgi:glycosidase
MTSHWADNAIFYHIYPLGLTAAPAQNAFNAPITHRLDALLPWLDHIHALGANSIYLGPVFESTSHGYDTIDYYHVDRRLGDHADLVRLANAIHERGMRLVLDAVFNHVGRDFWAFKDLQAHGQASTYVNWFHGLNFNGHSPLGDPFQYEGWQGHYSLVKLNLGNPDVRTHLFGAVEMWMDEFGIDGLRLDAADCIDLDFLQALHQVTQQRRPDFWLLGEVVHGDYRKWANQQTLDSVTNYESYKGLYSSFNDRNFHEIAYSLDRQFGSGGLYRDLPLYNFIDNHDVDRIASKLMNPTHLYPLYLLLFTMPGIPSVYYGSEWGIEGKKAPWSDEPLRPALDLRQMQANSPHPNLGPIIKRLSDLRSQFKALSSGIYQQVHVESDLLAFTRQVEAQRVLVVINSATQPKVIKVTSPLQSGRVKDVLNSGETFPLTGDRLEIPVPPMWGRILIPA